MKRKASSRRYDPIKVRRELDKLVGHDNHVVVLMREKPEVADHEAAAIGSWLQDLVTTATSGSRPDLSLFPQLGITSLTPPSDFRWTMQKHAYADLFELGQAGCLVMPATATGNVQVTAVQVISNSRYACVRINEAVRGVLWASVSSTWLQVGWDLPLDERNDSTHITILECMNGAQPATLVFWNVTPSIIRAASPQKLLSMQDRSIGVAAERKRWLGMRNQVDPDEVRSALFMADRLGIPQESRGTFIVDYIAPRRKEAVAESHLGQNLGDAFKLDELAGESNLAGPEDQVLRAEEMRSAQQELEMLLQVANGEERKVIEAMRLEFQRSDNPSIANAARLQGLDLRDVMAVLKRLRRKLPAKKIK